MDTESIYKISLLAAYIAGAVALFAPCCISYLLPAYLGNIFKERKQVLFMTLVYSAGIFVVMLPIVLGAKALSTFFFGLHNQTYIIGGVFMLFVAVLALLGMKLPMPHFSMKQKNPKDADVLSTFTLGVFSGITSACCAPVLVGVLALSSISATTAQAVGVGAAYVFGMVTPLYLAALFIHKKDILKKPILKKVLREVKIGKKVYPIFVANVVAFFIFAVTGILLIGLTLSGGLGMNVSEAAVTKFINDTAFRVTDALGGLPGLDILFVLVGMFLLYLFVKEATGSKEE